MKLGLSSKHESGFDNSSTHRNYHNLKTFSNNPEQPVTIDLNPHVSTETSKTIFSENSDLSSNNCDIEHTPTASDDASSTRKLNERDDVIKSKRYTFFIGDSMLKKLMVIF